MQRRHQHKGRGQEHRIDGVAQIAYERDERPGGAELSRQPPDRKERAARERRADMHELDLRIKLNHAICSPKPCVSAVPVDLLALLRLRAGGKGGLAPGRDPQADYEPGEEHRPNAENCIARHTHPHKQLN